MIDFYMLEAREIRTKRDDGLPGLLLGRYLPGLSYRLTPKNQADVETWITEGVAKVGVAPGSAAAHRLAGGLVGGAVKTD